MHLVNDLSPTLLGLILLAVIPLATASQDESGSDSWSPNQYRRNGSGASTTPAASADRSRELLEIWTSLRFGAILYLIFLTVRFRDLLAITRSGSPSANSPTPVSPALVTCAVVASLAWAAAVNAIGVTQFDLIMLAVCNIVISANLDAGLWVEFRQHPREKKRLLYSDVVVRGGWVFVCVCLKPFTTDSQAVRQLYTIFLSSSFFASSLLLLIIGSVLNAGISCAVVQREAV